MSVNELGDSINQYGGCKRWRRGMDPQFIECTKEYPCGENSFGCVANIEDPENTYAFCGRTKADNNDVLEQKMADFRGIEIGERTTFPGRCIERSNAPNTPKEDDPGACKVSSRYKGIPNVVCHRDYRCGVPGAPCATGKLRVKDGNDVFVGLCFHGKQVGKKSPVKANNLAITIMRNKAEFIKDPTGERAARTQAAAAQGDEGDSDATMSDGLGWNQGTSSVPSPQAAGKQPVAASNIGPGGSSKGSAGKQAAAAQGDETDYEASDESSHSDDDDDVMSGVVEGPPSVPSTKSGTPSSSRKSSDGSISFGKGASAGVVSVAAQGDSDVEMDRPISNSPPNRPASNDDERAHSSDSSSDKSFFADMGSDSDSDGRPVTLGHGWR